MLIYGALDVSFLQYSLGASPSESEFHKETGRLQIGDGKQLKVLQNTPKPRIDSPVAKWYYSSETQ